VGPDTCEHGVEGWCRLCCAVHEGKLSAEDAARIARGSDEPKSFEDCMTEDDDHHC